MQKLLILYASKNGSTTQVANFIGKLLNQKGIETDLQNVFQFEGDIESYDAIIIGSPIYKGVWLTSFWRIIRQLQFARLQKPIWGFSLCVRVLETDGLDYAIEHYLPHDLLEKLNLRDFKFFAGRLQNLTPSERTEFHAHYDGVNGRNEGDFRDWNAISAWVYQIIAEIDAIAVD